MPPVIDKILRAGEGRTLRKLKKLADQVNSIEDDYLEMSDAELREQTEKFREEFAEEVAKLTEKGKNEKEAERDVLNELLPYAFATAREAARRVLGQRHFDVQVMGGVALHLSERKIVDEAKRGHEDLGQRSTRHVGYIAEMRTGEGKTLTSVLPAYLNALTGRGVHIVTVNDYLAKRDAEWMGRVHQFLGLEVGVVLPQMTPDERRAAYNCDITYGTNNEFGFDYLRDNMAWTLDECVQRGHYFAIVDEVDSILIDEARTPLIISGPAEQNSKWYGEFAKFVTRLRGVEIIEERLKSEDDKQWAREAREKYDYEYDPKKRTVGVLEKGVEKIEDQLGIDNLYDLSQASLVPYLNNALKAKEHYKRDKDYVVMNGEVLIVDEFTGRILHGRRYNEGMHQAIEAKEGVTIKDENQTLATITLQNYFRLYEKLSGMTGTAHTEAAEFNRTYKLGVVEIPTNKPMVRDDVSDVVYKTEQAKFEAVVDDIAERNQKGQPVLVGTTSVEKSEKLSKMLKRRGISHKVLNAKHHEKEGAIVAEAGRKGAVTVATNMAGRGTDIMLGGNPDFRADLELHQRGLSPLETPEEYESAWPEALEKAKEAVEGEHEEVVEAGGLYVLGTERHESRRIDNQLRGRSGRQGDPGVSKFYLSLEDDLMRLFNAARVDSIMTRLNIPDDVPIESKIVTNAIRSAQSQVEQQNFEMRKNVLKYDDVLNRQRKVIYAERRKVLEGEDLEDQVRRMIDEVVAGYVAGATSEGFAEDWDLDKLWTAFRALYSISITVDDLVEEAGGDISALDAETLAEKIREDAQAAYDKREKELSAEVMRQLERRVVLSVMDRKWREHLYEMDYLQEGIGLRAMAQRDPLVEYQREGYDMFNAMLDGIKEESVGYLFALEVEVEDEPETPAVGAKPVSVAKSAPAADAEEDTVSSDDDDVDEAADTPVIKAKGLEKPSRPKKLDYSAPTVDGEGGVEHHSEETEDEYAGVNRNDPCPCGSGKKFKRCHGDPRNRNK
ncbi:preprotein translocase subunit SecA [Actinomadura sp. KC345]|uniref:preprotein translocase subunit SecA n=1 Tax=Actinomadura sp. KC345 TaxID=2530371 RepID=UPI00104790A0|nr:preprotein translocase subunit SecA [Actinomadura sp. KC345]TDC45954.1 preprotein translocase subunit SecA [Actinomadura sp. KC345]